MLIEGDDPIALDILLDLNVNNGAGPEQVEDAIGGLAPRWLHAIDDVTVYSMRCNLSRSADAVATGSAVLTAIVKASSKAQSVRLHPGTRACPVQWHLRDALADMAVDLAKKQGRRVILAVTDGDDMGSQTTWNELRGYAQEKGIAIFGMAPSSDLLTKMGLRLGSQEAAFNSVCELTGGMVLPFGGNRAAEALAQFVALVRGRYIVEFPSPISTHGGYHNMRISIAHSDAFIRPAGAVAPVENPAIANNPMTVPNNPGNAPQLGKRKVVGPQ